MANAVLPYRCVSPIKMKLSVEDRVKNLLPAWLYYPYKIVARHVRSSRNWQCYANLFRRCTAIDVGANRGYYSWALAALAPLVEAFEPNPVLPVRPDQLGRKRACTKWRFRSRGSCHFYSSAPGEWVSLHIIGNLGNVYTHDDVDEIQVRLATLDSYGFENVGFLKIDVEGSEMEALAGHAKTFGFNRPSMLIELLAGIHEDHLARIEQIENDFGYDAWIVIGREKFEAKQALAELESLRKTSNILFTPAARWRCLAN
jgi:FkbM family methyltransferase